MQLITNPVPWPDNARCAVALTWDLDADSGLNYYNPDRADTLVNAQVLTRYGPNVAVPRLISLGAHLGIPQTFFVPGWVIEKYTYAVESLAAAGNEIALHGYLHERPNELSGEDELYWLKRGIASYRTVLGKAPTGWRAPSFAFSKYSLRYLIDEGFEYDSSLMSDDSPHWLDNEGDRLLELPTQWCLDDWPHYMHGREFNYNMPISAPAKALEVYRAEFDAAWRHGGLWISVWHPFLSGRPARVEAILELFEYMQAKGRVWFATTQQIRDHVSTCITDGTWTPRSEQLPAYQSPIPELAKP